MWIFILSRLYSTILRYRWTCSPHVPLRSLHLYQLTTLPLLLMTRKLTILSIKAMHNMLNIRMYHPTDESNVAKMTTQIRKECQTGEKFWVLSPSTIEAVWSLWLRSWVKHFNYGRTINGHWYLTCTKAAVPAFHKRYQCWEFTGSHSNSILCMVSFLLASLIWLNYKI